MSRGHDLGLRTLMALALWAAVASGCVEDAPPFPGSDGGAGDGGVGDASGAGGSARGGAGGTGAGGAGGIAGMPGTGGGAAGAGGTGMTGMGGAAGAIGGPGSVPGTIVRTLAYHQVSSLTATPTGQAVISADGSRIAYPVALPPAPNKIFVMNADGTGTVEVDSYTPLCHCNSMVAVSADGRTVVSSDHVQVRVVGIDGKLKGSLITGSNEITNIDITADGSTVFMLHRRNNSINGGPVERGLWAMNADGTNHRQIVSVATIAAATGVTADKVFPFSGCGKSLEVSGDGSKGVVSLNIAELGEHVFAFDGAVVRKLKGPVQFVQQVAISNDATRVAISTGHMNVQEVSVMGIDGGGVKVLGNQPQGSCFSPLSINADGSQVLSGSIGLLYATAGGDPLTLQPNTGGDGYGVGAPCCDVDPLFSMNGDGKRLAYLNLDGGTPGSVRQIAVLDINPASLGASPVITSPTLSTASIPRDRSLGAAVSCRVAPAGTTTLVRAGIATLLRGVEDRAGSWVSGNQPLRDDGMRGDPTASDGIFTTDAVITSGTGGEVGPRIIRIKAESKSSDGRRHATAVDFSGLEVK